MQADWVSYGIGGGGLLVGLISVMLYLRGRREKRPTFRVISNGEVVVVKERARSDVEIRHKPSGNIIENLFYADILLWNGGKDPIRASDLVATNPLRVELEHSTAKVLSALVVESTRSETEFQVERVLTDGNPTNAVTCSLSFLDHEDGARVAIAYADDRASPIQVKGTIVGAPNGFRQAKERFAASKFMYWAVVSSGVAVFISSASLAEVLLKTGRKLNFLVPLGAFVLWMALLSVFFTFLPLIMQRRQAHLKKKLGLRYYFKL